MLLRSLFALGFFAFVLSKPTSYVQRPKQPNQCPSGWINYRESCYYFEPKMMQFDKAEVRCLERNAMLFTADSVEEYTEVMKHTPASYFTWVGMKQRDGESEPTWISSGGIKSSQLDWLIPSGVPATNGWNTYSNCVARFNSAVSKPYSYFFFCGMDFYSICEKNATLLKNIWDVSAIDFAV